MDEIQRLAEKVRELHYTIATSENRIISTEISPIYSTSKALFIAAIQDAYPNLRAQEVYERWCDCGEDIAWIVQKIQRERENTVELEDGRRVIVRANGYVTVTNDLDQYDFELPAVDDVAQECDRTGNHVVIPVAHPCEFPPE